MGEYKKEIGKFMVGIRLLKETENRLVSETRTIESNMPKEKIIKIGNSMGITLPEKLKEFGVKLEKN